MRVPRRAWKTGLVGVALSAVLAGGLWSGSQGASTALAAPGVRASSSSQATRQTSFQLVNMGTAAATVQVQFYSQSSGQITYNGPAGSGVTLAANGGSLLLDQRFDTNMPSPFTGAAIALGNQRLAGIVNEFQADGGTDGYNAVGNDEVTTTAICPVVFAKTAGQGGKLYNSNVNVQAAGSSASVGTITIRNLSGTQVKQIAFNLNPGMSTTYVLEDDTGLPANLFGSATVQSTNGQPVAAAVEQYTNQQLVDYACYSAGSTDAVAPVVFRYDNFYRTSTIVANSGSAAAAVTLNFVFADPTTGTTDATKNVNCNISVPANSAAVIDQGFSTPASCQVGNNFFGSLKATSTGATPQPIAVLVQELSNGDIRALAYKGIPSAALGTTVVAPAVFADIVDSTSGVNFSTSTVVINPNAQAANLTIVYKPSTGSNITKNKSVPANSSLLIDHRIGAGTSGDLPSGFFGSMTVTSNVPVGLIVNELTSLSQEQGSFVTTLKDPIIGYNGIKGS